MYVCFIDRDVQEIWIRSITQGGKLRIPYVTLLGCITCLREEGLSVVITQTLGSTKQGSIPQEGLSCNYSNPRKY